MVLSKTHCFFCFTDEEIKGTKICRICEFSPTQQSCGTPDVQPSKPSLITTMQFHLGRNISCFDLITPSTICCIHHGSSISLLPQGQEFSWIECLTFLKPPICNRHSFISIYVDNLQKCSF